VTLAELFANGDYEHDTGFFFSYEKDDAIIFGENGVQTIDPGTLLPDDGTAYQNVTTANYEVDELFGVLYLQMPWEYNADYSSYDEPLEYCSIQEYNKNKLVLVYTRNDDNNPTKSQNTFIITYEPAK
jgi:hypothetical protein